MRGPIRIREHLITDAATILTYPLLSRMTITTLFTGSPHGAPSRWRVTIGDIASVISFGKPKSAIWEKWGIWCQINVFGEHLGILGELRNLGGTVVRGVKTGFKLCTGMPRGIMLRST